MKILQRATPASLVKCMVKIFQEKEQIKLQTRLSCTPLGLYILLYHQSLPVGAALPMDLDLKERFQIRLLSRRLAEMSQLLMANLIFHTQHIPKNKQANYHRH